MKTPKLPKIVIEDELKIITLVCYLLENLGSLTESQLLETVTVEDIVPQFKLGDALTTMEKKQFMTVTGNAYRLEEAGKNWLSQFENSIAVTLRKKMLNEGKKVMLVSDLKKTAKWGVSKTDKGWCFHAHLLNEFDGTPVMEINLYSKTEQGVLEMQEKFLKNPAKVLSSSISNFL